MLNFKITKLDINQSYFFGEVEFRSDKYKVNIQNERRGKVLRLPFQIDSKKEKSYKISFDKCCHRWYCSITYNCGS